MTRRHAQRFSCAERRFGPVSTYDGEVYRPVALFAMSGNFGDVARSLAFTEDRGSLIGRAVPDMGSAPDLQPEPRLYYPSLAW